MLVHLMVETRGSVDFKYLNCNGKLWALTCQSMF